MVPVTRIRDVELAALDVETTGLFPERGDRVIEVAVVRGRLGETPRTWSTLVFPDRPVAATHVHGLTDADVLGAPRFSAVAATIGRVLQGAVFVAHNASFDLRFLELESRLAGLSPPRLPVLDTLGLARRHLGLPSHSLAALCARFSIRREAAHRALADARATWELAWHLLGVIDPEGGLDVDGAVRACRRRTAEEHQALRRALLEAQGRGQRLTIDYLAGDRVGEGRTRRAITVQRVLAQRVVAWCHLRDAERTFRLDRLRVVPDYAPNASS